jgi:Tol biopolymer transport system component
MRRKLSTVLSAAVVIVAVGEATPAGAVGVVGRPSVATGGAQGNADSVFPTISADGRFVAYDSIATSLVPGDANGENDVFLRDRQMGTTELVSVATGGAQGNAYSNLASISGDGRYVAFASGASNLVTGDVNGEADVFVRDRQRGTTELVSVATSGAQGNAYSQGPRVSLDGRYVAFESGATNLVPGDNNGEPDVFVRDLSTGRTTRASIRPDGAQFAAASLPAVISANGRYVGFSVSLRSGLWLAFVHDRKTGRTTRLSVGMGGARANGNVFVEGISADGRLVALTSTANNLVPGDTNGALDIFVRDLRSGSTTPVSVGPDGAQANGHSLGASLSADGQYVAFVSLASNLVLGDTNDTDDVFVHDRRMGRTTRVSVARSGAHGDFNSENPAISADGRFVAFDSAATNLVRGDTNGVFDVFVATTR